MILPSILSIDLPMLGTSELIGNGGLEFSSVVAPAAIALIVGFAVVAIGLAIRHDVD